MIAIKHSMFTDPPKYWGLCFTAKEAGATVAMRRVGSSAPSVSIETSFDGESWTPFYVGSTVISLKRVGDRVYFRQGSSDRQYAKNTSNYNNFKITGRVAASGSLKSMRRHSYNTVFNFYFANLFKDCTSLISAPELPDPALTAGYYFGMFENCTSLITAPDVLPAKYITQSAYSYMFAGCSSLTIAPRLLAVELEDRNGGLYPGKSACQGMFQDCTSLISAPELPITSLKEGCYGYMFSGCTSLSAAPKLPATTLEKNCYRYMFQDCTSLISAPELPATSLTEGCYSNMFSGSKSVNLISTKQDSFTGCDSWLNDVSPTGTIICPVALGTNETITRGTSACPDGWTVINED